MPGTAEIRAFLAEFKRCLHCHFHFVGREKNLAALAEVGLTTTHAKQIIAALAPEDYCSGPDPDRCLTGNNVWVFGTTINNREFYIKLSDDFSGDYAKCLSFHPAEQPLHYPLRRRR